MRYILISTLLILSCHMVSSQSILPTPLEQNNTNSRFKLSKTMLVAFSDESQATFDYLEKRLKDYIKFKPSKNKQAAKIALCLIEDKELGDEGYRLSINSQQIKIIANKQAGLFYGIQSFLQLLPVEVQSGKAYKLAGFKLNGLELKDQPKYAWRSFMLDSGRQFQSVDFIKRYLDYMAMLKMNVFHWHLTEGEGWRIEIKKYPKLTEVGSKVAKKAEQQGYYTQEEIKEIVSYAKKLHITVVPEIDVPGHSDAALNAYPEHSCLKEAPEIKDVFVYTDKLFCGGRESTYLFIQDIIDEVCELFPSEYIHLGGDEAPKKYWNTCSDCQARIKSENLDDSHDLQLYFSARLAEYVKTKGKKVILWGDVIYQEGSTKLPDNVIVHWWNWLGKKDLALRNAIKNGHQVICNTSHKTYLNYPLSPWKMYSQKKTFDLKEAYEENPSHIENPDQLILGMGACLWTNRGVKENMIDQRVFPRIFALSEQMWCTKPLVAFDEFYDKVKSKYPLMDSLGIDYCPALKSDLPKDYKWE